MAIRGLDDDRFKAILRRNLSPARAISDPAHLRGREKKLRTIERAFNSPGKHVFIYGDRGVGKTSLAQSAAVLHQSADGSPIVIACDEYADFYKMVAAMAQKCLSPKDSIERPLRETKHGIRIPGLSSEMHQGLQRGIIPKIEGLNDAVIILQYVAETHSQSPVIIVDEFDQVKDHADRKRFADLIKQVSDQEIDIRFIFCGIGPSLEELIGVHLSTDRYIAPIPLERLSHDALWEILNATASELGVSIGHEENVRISTISDGFPYYVHLIGEHMFWAMFDDEEYVERVALEHFDAGIKGAIAEAVGSLKQAYNLAVQKRAQDYEEVLWAVADGTMMERQSPRVYEDSYVPIMRRRNGREAIDIKTFYQRMNRLKKPAHGNILMATKTGWYKFRENVMRGYVRLMAEDAGIELGIDHHLAPQPNRRRVYREE